jgi:hypothetical protein
MTQRNGSTDTEESVGDIVTNTVARVRDELASRRRRGELPELPGAELGLQFDGVVEAVDALLIEQPPLDTDALRRLAQLPNWRPALTGGPLRRVAGIVMRQVARIVGLVVRRQVTGFAHVTGDLVVEIERRQQKATAFLARAHLDRVRSLEYRVAQLEEELDRLRAGRPVT